MTKEEIILAAVYAAAGAGALAVLGEWIHARRVKRLARLAFGPDARPRVWTVMAPLLRAIDTVLARDERGATVDEVARAFVRGAEREPFVILRRPLDDSADEFRTVIKRGRELAADDRTALLRDVSVALFRHMVAAPRRRDTLT